jgi:hypothetical protein
VVKVTLTPASQAAFVDAIQKFAAASKQTIRDATLEQAALACQDAANFTPPLTKGGGGGLSNSAKKAGEKAVDRDVGKVFELLTGGGAGTQANRVIKRLGSLALNNNQGLFWKVASTESTIIAANEFVARMLSPQYKGFGTDQGFKRAKNYFNRIGNRVAAQALNSQSFAPLEGTAAIDAVYRPVYQRTQGRLYKNSRNVSGVNSRDKRVVERKADLDTYIAQRQDSVGAIKSGWYKALMSLPRPVINGVEKNAGSALRAAGWITKHSSVAGQSVTQFSDKLADVTIRNLSGNIFGIADQAGVLGLVYGNRVKQMPAKVQRLIAADVAKFNRK